MECCEQLDRKQPDVMHKQDIPYSEAEAKCHELRNVVHEQCCTLKDVIETRNCGTSRSSALIGKRRDDVACIGSGAVAVGDLVSYVEGFSSCNVVKAEHMKRHGAELEEDEGG